MILIAFAREVKVSDLATGRSLSAATGEVRL